VKEALEKIGAGVPDAISAAEVEMRINTFEAAVTELDVLSVERMRLVNEKE